MHNIDTQISIFDILQPQLNDPFEKLFSQVKSQCKNVNFFDKYEPNAYTKIISNSKKTRFEKKEIQVYEIIDLYDWQDKSKRWISLRFWNSHIVKSKNPSQIEGGSSGAYELERAIPIIEEWLNQTELPNSIENYEGDEEEEGDEINDF